MAIEARLISAYQLLVSAGPAPCTLVKAYLWAAFGAWLFEQCLYEIEIRSDMKEVITLDSVPGEVENWTHRDLCGVEYHNVNQSSVFS